MQNNNNNNSRLIGRSRLNITRRSSQVPGRSGSRITSSSSSSSSPSAWAKKRYFSTRK